MIRFRLEEVENENSGQAIDSVLESIGEKLRHDSVRIRVQQPTSGTDRSRPRPIQVNLSSAAYVFKVNKATRALMSTEHYSNVFIRPDRSIEERKLRRKGVTALTEKRQNDPSKRHYTRN